MSTRDDFPEHAQMALTFPDGEHARALGEIDRLRAAIKRTSDSFWSDHGLNNTHLLDAVIELRRIANPDVTYGDDGYPLKTTDDLNSDDDQGARIHPLTCYVQGT